MHFFKSLLAGAALVASVVAQAPGQLAFTSFPSDVSVGNPVTVTWAGGNQDAPVTITLRRGPSDNLKDVAVLTSSATGGSYTWVPANTLESGDNYALQISQDDAINYTNQFSIKGGSSGSETSAPSGGKGPNTKTITMTLTDCDCAGPTTPPTAPTASATMPSPPKNTTVPTISKAPSPTAPEQPPAYTGGSAVSSVFSTPLVLVAAILAGFAYIN